LVKNPVAPASDQMQWQGRTDLATINYELIFWLKEPPDEGGGIRLDK
jgi:hypothetical protein